MHSNQARATAGDIETPHLTMLHRFGAIFFFLAATPLAMWLAVSFVLPLFFGLIKQPDAFMEYLHRVESFELGHAKIVSPEMRFAGAVVSEEAWPYKLSNGVVKRIVPQETQGMFVSARDAERARLQSISARAAHLSSPGSSNESVERMSQKLNSWLTDRFYPVQTVWLTILLTRGLYALQILPLALIAALAAFFVGEYNARTRSLHGFMPLGNRFSGWMHVLKYAIATIPGFLALPAPAPTLPILIGLYTLAIYSVARARTHFVEF
jgi:hypothetical protein